MSWHLKSPIAHALLTSSEHSLVNKHNQEKLKSISKELASTSRVRV